MRIQQLSTLALCASVAQALQNASPLFAFSSVPTSFNNDNNNQFASGSHVSSAITQALEACPADAYIIVKQPHVSALDFGSQSATPFLRRRMIGNDSTSSYHASIPEVIGEVDMKMLQRTLVENCGATIVEVDATRGVKKFSTSNSFPQVITVEFPALPESPADERAAVLQEHDNFLKAIVLYLDVLTTSHLTILTTTPPLTSFPSTQQDQDQDQDHPHYAADDKYQHAMHTDLKRDLHSHVLRAASNSSSNSNAALFEKYGFLSPGIFMGGLTVLLLFLILYVGVTAIAGLEIPVMAFSKEMGPSGQKKAQ